ncbi:MAG: hypothetical protein DYG89_47205 [Caldilinea sp. CFX5]|nr:hypothetical protein [Caldilinea sp. CFX5]
MKLIGEVKRILPEVTCPLLVIYSRGDPTIHPQSAQLVYDRVRSTDKAIIALQASGHVITIDGEWRQVAEESYPTQQGSDWLWLEHLTDAVTGSWQLAHYAYAAHQLGRFNAAYLQGSPLPAAPWLCRGHARTWAEGLPPQAAWDDPIVQRFFSHTLHERVTQLWTERERFYAVLERLPQVFSHFDFQRRNLFLRPGASGQQEIVAVDWALCGIGALGGDLYSLVGSSAALLEWSPTQLAVLDKAVFAAYVNGLAVGGWAGDLRLARLGYTTWLALYWGMALPAAAAFWFAGPMAPRAIRQFGRPLAELAAAWATLCDFSLARADEARQLMKQIAQ